MTTEEIIKIATTSGIQKLCKEMSNVLIKQKENQLLYNCLLTIILAQEELLDRVNVKRSNRIVFDEII